LKCCSNDFLGKRPSSQFQPTVLFNGCMLKETPIRCFINSSVNGYHSLLERDATTHTCNAAASYEPPALFLGVCRAKMSLESAIPLYKEFFLCRPATFRSCYRVLSRAHENNTHTHIKRQRELEEVLRRSRREDNSAPEDSP
jgi:hypothetical protein